MLDRVLRVWFWLMVVTTAFLALIVYCVALVTDSREAIGLVIEFGIGYICGIIAIIMTSILAGVITEKEKEEIT